MRNFSRKRFRSVCETYTDKSIYEKPIACTAAAAACIIIRCDDVFDIIHNFAQCTQSQARVYWQSTGSSDVFFVPFFFFCKWKKPKKYSLWECARIIWSFGARARVCVYVCVLNAQCTYYFFRLIFCTLPRSTVIVLFIWHECGQRANCLISFFFLSFNLLLHFTFPVVEFDWNVNRKWRWIEHRKLCVMEKERGNSASKEEK